VITNTVSGGTYYLEAYSGSGTYQIEIVAKSQNDADSGADAGDSPEKATSVSLPGEFGGLLGGFDEEDWYRFQIPAGFILELAVSIDLEGIPIQFALQNVERRKLWLSGAVMPGTSKTTRLILNSSTGGSYYVAAYGGQGRYNVNLSFESQDDADSGSDAGDEITAALKIEAATPVRGQLGGLDKEDWYTFSARGRKSLYFSSTQGSQALRVSLHNAARREILDSGDLMPGAPQTLVIPEDIQAPFYIKVYGGQGEYGLEIK
jgi:hypothetical protein